MTSTTKRIILIVVGTILLPIILFVVYDISSLQDDEEMIQAVYENQLDFVIFSANQFSNDFLDNLVKNLEDNLDDQGQLNLTPKTETLLSYSGCQYLNMKRIAARDSMLLHSFPKEKDERFEEIIEELHTEKIDLIRQLGSYKENGYTKIQPDDLLHVEKVHLEDGSVADLDLQVLLAVMQAPAGHLYLMTALINPGTFANDVLSPQLQQIAQQNLVISLADEAQGSLVYSTDTVASEIIASKTMWLFPSLELGISLKSKSLQQLVDQRLRYNLAASAILILVLLFGLALVARTTLQQMKLAQTKSDFVSNVSHELRTPLALISMFAETLMLGRAKNEEKKAEYVEIIYKETNRLTRIVNRILNFQQVEAGRKKYHFVDLDINQVVEELLHDYSYHLEQNGFDFKVEKDRDMALVKADKESIYEVLVNLMDNAIKYSKEEKFIGIKTMKKNGSAIIEVSDRGIGIPKEKVDHIFDKFYRVAEGDVHNVQGAGLGLSLVSSIMEAHGGNVDVRSELGKGSSFRLIFNQN
ncbi:MAG: HAMP domain-containing sensor histidine kinase [Bacteroidota bacterium]